MSKRQREKPKKKNIKQSTEHVINPRGGLFHFNEPLVQLSATSAHTHTEYTFFRTKYLLNCAHNSRFLFILIFFFSLFVQILMNLMLHLYASISIVICASAMRMLYMSGSIRDAKRKRERVRKREMEKRFLKKESLCK